MSKWIHKCLKKYKWIAVIIIILFVFSSCSNGGRYKIIMGGIQSTRNSLKGSYKDFSGYYFKTVRLKANDHLDIRFDQKTRSGTLTAELMNGKGQIVYKSDPNKNSNQVISILKTGRYRMEVIGLSHSGSFELNWNTR